MQACWVSLKRGYEPQMVKVIGLTVAVFAFWTCAPAQADVLPIPVSTEAAPSPVHEVVGKVAPVVTNATETVRATTAPTRATVRSAAAAAQPAAAAVVARTTVQTAQGRAGDSGGLRVGASSLRRVPSARLRRSVPQHAHAAPAGRERRADTRTTLAASAQHGPADAKPVARPEHQSPPNPAPAPRSDGGMSAGSAGLFAGGLAMLAGALVLVAPRWRRSLFPDRAALRPVAFVALLERPG